MRFTAVLIFLLLAVVTGRPASADANWHQLACSARHEHQDGNYAKAENQWLEAISLLPENDPRLPESYLELSSVYLILKRTSDAERVLEAGITAIEHVKPIDIDIYQQLLQKYSLVLRRLGKFDLAQHYFDRWKNIVPSSDAGVPAIEIPPWKEELTAGDRANDKDDWTAAELHWNESLSECERLGRDNVRSAQPLKRLLDLHCKTKQYDKAEPLMRKYIALCREWYGEFDPRTGAVFAAYSQLLRGMDKNAEAQKFKNMADQIKKQTRIQMAVAPSEASVNLERYAEETRQEFEMERRRQEERRQHFLREEEQIRTAAEQARIRTEIAVREFEAREMQRYHETLLSVTGRRERGEGENPLYAWASATRWVGPIGPQPPTCRGRSTTAPPVSVPLGNPLAVPRIGSHQRMSF